MSVTVEADVSQVLAAAARYRAAPAVVGQELLVAGREAILGVEGAAKGLAPRDTGQLVGSISSFATGGMGGFVATAEATAEHALWQHEGTGVYAGRGPIRPRASRFLSWVGAGGVRIFAKQVRGVPPTKFMTKALAAERGRIDDAMRRAAQRVAARMGGR